MCMCAEGGSVCEREWTNMNIVLLNNTTNAHTDEIWISIILLIRKFIQQMYIYLPKIEL